MPCPVDRPSCPDQFVFPQPPTASRSPRVSSGPTGGARSRTAERRNGCRVVDRRSAHLFLCVAIAAVVGLGACQASAQQGPANVVIGTVIREDVAARQSFVGTVVANRQVVVGSAVDGRVLDFPLKAGQAVAQGQTIAQLRTLTIEIEISGAKAELQLRMAELEELRNGALPEELRLAEAVVEAAQSMREYSQAKLTRSERLMEAGAGISQDEYEQAQAESLRSVALLSEATSRLDLVRRGPREERIAQAAARVAVQEQIIAGLEDRLDKYTVKAPFDGFIVNELTESGAWVQQGMAVAEIVELDPIEIEAYVPESNIGFVRLGNQVAIRVDGLPGRTFDGEVVRIVPLADPRARTFPVKVRVANPMEEGRHPLLPGMLSRVSLPTGVSRPMLMVPKDALQLGGAQPAVLKVADQKAVLVPVTTGPSLDSWISVTPTNEAALADGDPVIVRGNERLRDGQPVIVSSKIDFPRP